MGVFKILEDGQRLGQDELAIRQGRQQTLRIEGAVSRLQLLTTADGQGNRQAAIFEAFQRKPDTHPVRGRRKVEVMQFQHFRALRRVQSNGYFPPPRGSLDARLPTPY